MMTEKTPALIFSLLFSVIITAASKTCQNNHSLTTYLT